MEEGTFLRSVAQLIIPNTRTLSYNMRHTITLPLINARIHYAERLTQRFVVTSSVY